MALHEGTVEQLQASALVIDEGKTHTYSLANDGGIFYDALPCLYQDRPVMLIPQVQLLVKTFFEHPHRPLSAIDLNKRGYRELAGRPQTLNPDLERLCRLTQLGSHIVRIGPGGGYARYIFTEAAKSFEGTECGYAENRWPDASLKYPGFKSFLGRGIQIGRAHV